MKHSETVSVVFEGEVVRVERDWDPRGWWKECEDDGCFFVAGVCGREELKFVGWDCARDLPIVEDRELEW